jgi:hypothetical protein
MDHKREGNPSMKLTDHRTLFRGATFTSSGLTDESVVMAYVECSGEHSDPGNSDSERIETHFVSPAGAGRLCRDDSVLIDVKTWLVLDGFARSGRL